MVVAERYRITAAVDLLPEVGEVAALDIAAGGTIKLNGYAFVDLSGVVGVGADADCGWDVVEDGDSYGGVVGFAEVVGYC